MRPEQPRQPSRRRSSACVPKPHAARPNRSSRAGATDVAPELATLATRGGLRGQDGQGAPGPAGRSQALRRSAATSLRASPLPTIRSCPEEWWRSQIGIDGLTPPGSGVPVTLVDSGVNLSHPEFAGRVDTEAAQRPGAGGHRRCARHRGRLGARRTAKRPRPRRHLPGRAHFGSGTPRAASAPSSTVRM